MKKMGFTLIEMVAVIFVMGLLAAAAVLALGHTVKEHRTDVLGLEVQQTDALVRSAARQSGEPQRLVFDSIHNQVLWEETGETAKSTIMMRLAENDALAVRTVDQDPAQERMEIDFSPAGYSPTYALRLDRGGVTGKWMVITGMTGQIFWTEDEKQVDAIFKSLDSDGLSAAPGTTAPSGPDPH